MAAPLCHRLGHKSGEFWDKLKKVKRYPLINGNPDAKPPRDVTRLLNDSLPKGATNIYYRRRVAGAGSLGRPRYVAIADWRGGRVVREAKAQVPSAWLWAHGATGGSGLLELANGKYRAPDPFLTTRDKFVLRRLTPIPARSNLAPNAGRISRPASCRRWVSTSHRSTPLGAVPPCSAT